MAELEEITLPSGAWVKLRDPEDTTEAQRKPVTRLQMRMAWNPKLMATIKGEGSSSDLSDTEIDWLFDYNDAIVVALVESWSFEQPVTVDGLRAIPGKKDYSELQRRASKHASALMPSFEVDPDPEAPAGN